MTPLISEGEDAAHYYFAPYAAYPFRGEQVYAPLYFGAGQYGSTSVDLRDPGSVSGYAFIRSRMSPAELAATAQVPAAVLYAGQSIAGAIPVQIRQTLRTALGIRGQITSVKDILRSMLLTEAGENGKPGQLAADPDGGLFVYLGDLVVDLSREA